MQGFFSGSAGLVKGQLPACGEGGAFHHGNFADTLGQPLGDEGRVILDRFGEGQLLQPNAGENVAGLQNQQGMQPHGFQAAAVQQRQVQAGAHLLLQQGIAEPDPLARRLKAGRGDGIDQVFLLDGTVNRGAELQHPVGVLGLVGVQGGVSGPLAQQLRRPGIQGCNLGMVGSDEGCQQLRVVGIAVPLVKGQSRQLLGMAEQHGAVLLQGHMEQAGGLFRQSGKIGTVQSQVQRPGAVGGVTADAVVVLGKGQDQGRFRPQLQLHIFKGCFRVVDNGDGADDADTAALQGIVDGFQGGYLQPDGGNIGFLGHKIASQMLIIIPL